MSLLFGSLVNAFVEFGSTLMNNPDNPTLSNPAIKEASDNFARAAAKSASQLTYIGLGMFTATYIYMVVWVTNGEDCFMSIVRIYAKSGCRGEDGKAYS